MPIEIEGDPPTRPSGVFWICEGAVVGCELSRGTELTDDEIRESFLKALGSPIAHAPPGRPGRIRVATAQLAKRLRPLVSGVRVELGPTPEVDVVLDALTQATASPAAADAELLVATDEAWRPELVRLAQELIAAEPWDVVPPEPALEIRLASLGVEDGRLAVMGHNGETYGFMLFYAAKDLRTFERLADSDELRAGASMPACLSVNITELPVAAGEEPRPVALVRVFEGQLQRAPRERELRTAVAAGGALTRFIEAEWSALELLPLWALGIHGEYDVPVPDGEVGAEITARIPTRKPRARRRPR